MGLYLYIYSKRYGLSRSGAYGRKKIKKKRKTKNQKPHPIYDMRVIWNQIENFVKFFYHTPIYTNICTYIYHRTWSWGSIQTGAGGGCCTRGGIDKLPAAYLRTQHNVAAGKKLIRLHVVVSSLLPQGAVGMGAPSLRDKLGAPLLLLGSVHLRLSQFKY